MSVSVIFPQSVSVDNLAVGLTLAVARIGMSANEMDVISDSLKKCDHETIYTVASSLGELHGRKLAAEFMTYSELVKNGSPDCFMISRPGDKAACACFIDGSLLCPDPALAPDDHQKLTVIIPVNQPEAVVQ
jgi:hypothetical protein